MTFALDRAALDFNGVGKISKDSSELKTAVGKYAVGLRTMAAMVFLTISIG